MQKLADWLFVQLGYNQPAHNASNLRRFLMNRLRFEQCMTGLKEYKPNSPVVYKKSVIAAIYIYTKSITTFHESTSFWPKSALSWVCNTEQVTFYSVYSYTGSRNFVSVCNYKTHTSRKPLLWIVHQRTEGKATENGYRRNQRIIGLRCLYMKQ